MIQRLDTFGQTKINLARLFDGFRSKTTQMLVNCGRTSAIKMMVGKIMAKHRTLVIGKET